MSAPAGVVFQTALALKWHVDAKGNARSERAHHSFDASRTLLADNETEVDVWVIGEFARPHNWSFVWLRARHYAATARHPK